jgi:hypothetical protein
VPSLSSSLGGSALRFAAVFVPVFTLHELNGNGMATARVRSGKHSGAHWYSTISSHGPVHRVFVFWRAYVRPPECRYHPTVSTLLEG